MISLLPLLLASVSGSALSSGDGAGHSHAATAASAASQPAAPISTRTDLGNGLYTIMGRGGNILFSTGPDGTFVIDDQFADIAAENLALIDEVADTPVVFVLNTHHHGDHSGGNAPFVKAGATILAHDNVRARLAEAAKDDPEKTMGLPVITFSDTTTFHWNDKEIHVFHTPSAHTDGDALVHFRGVDVIHTGDTLFSGRYPYIDLGSGGTVDGALGALARVVELADDDTVIVPGHGPVSSKADVAATIEVITQARQLVRAEMMKGLSRDAVIAADPLAAYNDTYAWGFINGDRMAGTLFDDLMATDPVAKTAVERGPSQASTPQ